MNYTEACSFLSKIKNQSNIKFDLKTVLEILKTKPYNSKKNLRFLQVGGTNGKGSTCYYTSSILTKHGFKTGLFVSPHIENIRERICINHRWISEGEFAYGCSFVRDLSRELLSKKVIFRLPTFFEYLFLIGILYFIKNKVDYVVLEVGMGGRLDATSAVNPMVSVITKISLDHENYLGSSIIAIANEKAGIIKGHTPVISYQSQFSDAGRILKKKAQEKSAPFFQVIEKGIRFVKETKGGNYQYHSMRDYEFNLKNPAFHFGLNAACAIRTIEVLNSKYKIDILSETIERGISSVKIPGRIELIKLPGKPKITLDIGHNPDSFEALSKVLKSLGKKDLVVIFGVLRDKKYKKMLDKILRFVKIIIITEPESERGSDGNIIYNYLQQKKEVYYEKSIKGALIKALKWEKEILVVGSFYLVGPLKKILLDEVNSE